MSIRKSGNEMFLNNAINEELHKKGAEEIYYVDISDIDHQYTQGYSFAVIFLISLSKEYLRKVAVNNDYVKNMVINQLVEEDEFHQKEQKTDAIADHLANWLNSKGYSAYSQSEKNILEKGNFDEINHRTPLPHKAIALRSGLGWIGKNDLLITQKYGCAISMCSVLTDAPVITDNKSPVYSKCGECSICEEICPTNAIKGQIWSYSRNRDEIIEVDKCITCLKCMVLCPFTQKNDYSSHC